MQVDNMYTGWQTEGWAGGMGGELSAYGGVTQVKTG